MSGNGLEHSRNWFQYRALSDRAWAARDRRRALQALNIAAARNATLAAVPLLTLTSESAVDIPVAMDGSAITSTPAIANSASATMNTPSSYTTPLTSTVLQTTTSARIEPENILDQSQPPWEGESVLDGRHEHVATEYRALHSTGRLPLLASIADHEFLLWVFEGLRATGGPAPGPDRISYCDLGRSEVAEAMRHIAQRIRDREYRPGPARLVRILKGGNRYRRLHLRCIVDRVVASAVAMVLTPILERIFLPSSMGFRPRQGVRTVIASIARTAAATGNAVVTQDDVENAFPSVPVNDAIADYARHVTDEGLMWLIGAILRGNRTGAHLIGLDQGCPLSPPTMNLRMHYALDLMQHAAGLGYPLAYRYADNVVYLSASVSDGKHCLDSARNALAPAFRLKGEGNLHVNLRSQGAYADVLGYRLGLVNDQIRVGLGDKAFTGLHRALRKAPLTDSPSQAARRAVLAWLGAAGPAVESVGATETVGRVRRIAAQYEFRELGRVAELEDALMGAYQKWLRYRDGMARTGQQPACLP